MEQQAGLINGAIQDKPSFDAPVVSLQNGQSQIPDLNESLSNASDINENPLIANDDDLIEREWVERAKKIVEETRDNPHKQDDEVNKLQADYVNKRYSKKLGSS